jgi:hypothetical protein
MHAARTRVRGRGVTKTDRLMRQIAAQLVRLARAEIASIERAAEPRGKGSGHFRTVAEIRAAVARHEEEITELKRDVIDLTDMVADTDDGSRKRDGRHKRRGHI